MKKLIRKVEGNKIIVYLFISLCAVLMSLTTTNNPFCIGNTGVDSSVFHYVARVILDGGMPYRDTFDHKGPLIYLIDAIGLLINKNIGIWIMELIFISVTFFLAYTVAKMLGCSDVKALLVIVICALTLSYYFQGGNFVEEYAVPFIMVSLLIFTKYFLDGEASQFGLIICGGAFASVCLLRINMVVLWVAMGIGVLVRCIKRNEIKRTVKYIILFIIGVAVVVLPILVWLVKNGAFHMFIEDYFIFNFMYTSDAERASVKNVIKAAHYFATSGPVILTAPILLFLSLSGKKELDLLCLITLILSVAVMCMSGQMYDHYGMILCPLVVYAFSRFLSEISPKNTESKFALMISGICIVMMLFDLSFYQFAVSFARIIASHEPQTMTETREIAEIIKSNTSLDDTITVCGNRDLIYLLSERESSSIYSYQSPIADVNPAIKKEYLNDIKGLKAKIIVAESEGIWYERTRDILDDLQNILEEHYILIDIVGTTKVYLRTN